MAHPNHRRTPARLLIRHPVSIRGRGLKNLPNVGDEGDKEEEEEEEEQEDNEEGDNPNHLTESQFPSTQDLFGDSSSE